MGFKKLLKSIKKAMKKRAMERKEKRGNILNSSLIIVEYWVDPNCKQKRDIDTFCLKCGACGRNFSSGVLKDK